MDRRILILTLYISGKVFGICATQVHKVLPMTMLEAVPNAPFALAGLLHYNETLVPVIDLSRMIDNKESAMRRSTRLILVTPQSDEQQQPLLGLIAERVTETVEKQRSDARDDQIELPNAKYLGHVFPHPGGAIRMLSVGHILTHEMKQILQWQEAPVS